MVIYIAVTIEGMVSRDSFTFKLEMPTPADLRKTAKTIRLADALPANIPTDAGDYRVNVNFIDRGSIWSDPRDSMMTIKINPTFEINGIIASVCNIDIGYNLKSFLSSSSLELQLHHGLSASNTVDIYGAINEFIDVFNKFVKVKILQVIGSLRDEIAHAINYKNDDGLLDVMADRIYNALNGCTVAIEVEVP